MASTGPRITPLHHSLTRPILLGGVERELAVLEGTSLAALIFSMGFRLAPLTLAALIILVVHPLLRLAAKHDPQMLRVFSRHTFYASYYPAQAHPNAPPAHVVPFNIGIR